MACSSDHACVYGREPNCCGATRLPSISATDGSSPADFECLRADLVTGHSDPNRSVVRCKPHRKPAAASRTIADVGLARRWAQVDDFVCMMPHEASATAYKKKSVEVNVGKPVSTISKSALPSPLTSPWTIVLSFIVPGASLTTACSSPAALWKACKPMNVKA